MTINNETVGISAEVAIANAFGVKVNSDYSRRANPDILNYIQPNVINSFKSFNIPNPVQHCAERQNPVDFVLCNGQTLSVKSNKEKRGKVAPQIIGQPTVTTYFEVIDEILNFNIVSELKARGLNDEYKNRALIFKEISINRIDEIINIYWNHLFSCDYLLYIYNVVKGNVLLDNPCFMVFKKSLNPPVWNKANFSFTKSLDNWNESNTLKYCNISIGEFQVHNNRNCLKFRFNLDGIVSLLNTGIISYN